MSFVAGASTMCSKYWPNRNSNSHSYSPSNPATNSKSKPWYHSFTPGILQGNQGDDEQLQCQTETFDTTQVQATAEKQTLIQQIDDTFRTVVLAAEMAQDSKCNDHAVNSMTDAAIMTLNMMAVSCAEFHNEGKQDALDLARKATHDHWEQLKQEDGKTYAMTLKYHDFIVAALNGEKNLRYKENRVTAQKLFTQDPRQISQSFGRVIHQQQHFEAQQESYLDPAVNQELRERHGEELAQYRTSSKYQTAKNTANYQRPPQQQLYFTPSGQKAQFVNQCAEQEKKEMDDEVYGVENAYEAIKGKWRYKNSTYTNSAGKWWPCLIRIPKESQCSKVYDRIHVRRAYPYNDQIIAVHPDSLEFDVNKIKDYERIHAKKYGKNNLGYPSIQAREEQESGMDIE